MNPHFKSVQTAALTFICSLLSTIASPVRIDSLKDVKGFQMFDLME